MEIRSYVYARCIHRCAFGKQPEIAGIAGNLPSVGTGVDDFPPCLFCKNIYPTVFRRVSVTEAAPGIVGVGIGIAET